MKVYRVTLEASERQELLKLISRGKAAARRLAHARILLQADESAEALVGAAQKDQAISQGLGVSCRTVERVRERFVEQGLEAALNPQPTRRVYQRRLDGEGEAHLIALACSAAPTGHKRWTMRLLADRMVELEYVEQLSHETVRQTLKKTKSSRI